MASVDSRDYVLGGIFSSVLEPRRCAKHNAACQHSQQTWDVGPMLAHRLRLVVLTAGSYYKPTPTQCLLNAGPAPPVLASIYSALDSTSCWRERVHIQHCALLQTAKLEVSAYFTSVHLPTFGRGVTGNASDSEMEISAYFTSGHLPFLEGLWQKLLQRAKRKYYTWFTSEHIRPFRNTVTRKTEMNGTHRQRRTEWANIGKPTCPHLCVQRGDIIQEDTS